jgi:hypothetical protein
MKNKLILKCKHDYEKNLYIVDSRKSGDYIILRKATLEQTCKLCNKVETDFCLGGVVFPE